MTTKKCNTERLKSKNGYTLFLKTYYEHRVFYTSFGPRTAGPKRTLAAVLLRGCGTDRQTERYQTYVFTKDKASRVKHQATSESVAGELFSNAGK